MTAGVETRVVRILTLVFLPALYALWFRIAPPAENAEPDRANEALHPA